MLYTPSYTLQNCTRKIHVQNNKALNYTKHKQIDILSHSTQTSHVTEWRLRKSAPRVLFRPYFFWGGEIPPEKCKSPRKCGRSMPANRPCPILHDDSMRCKQPVMEYDREDTAARAYVGDPCISPPTQLIETRLDRPELVAAGRG